MSKLWLILGYISLGLALFGYLDQELLGASWSWEQVFSWLHHETLVMLCLIVGIGFVLLGLRGKYLAKM